jgi:hypothetical protein
VCSSRDTGTAVSGMVTAVNGCRPFSGHACELVRSRCD